MRKKFIERQILALLRERSRDRHSIFVGLGNRVSPQVLTRVLDEMLASKLIQLHGEMYVVTVNTPIPVFQPQLSSNQKLKALLYDCFTPFTADHRFPAG